MILLNNYDVLSLMHVLNYFIITHLAWNLHPVLSCEYVVVFAVFLCYYSFSCACITHNSLHSRVFRSQTLETIYHQILTLTYGHPAKTMVREMFIKLLWLPLRD